MPVIIAVTIPSKLLGFGKLSEFPQSPPFYLPSGGWTGPHPPRSGPCIVLTAVAPLASRAAGAEPQAAPSLPGKEPGAAPCVLSSFPAGRRRGQCPGQPAKLGPLFTSWGQGWCPS